MAEGRWVEVGAAWSKKDGLSLSISLGILGEISLLMKPTTNKRTSGSPDFVVIARSEDLLLGRLLGNKSRAPGGFAKQAEPASEKKPDDEGDIPF